MITIIIYASRTLRVTSEFEWPVRLCGVLSTIGRYCWRSTVKFDSSDGRRFSLWDHAVKKIYQHTSLRRIEIIKTWQYDGILIREHLRRFDRFCHCCSSQKTFYATAAFERSQLSRIDVIVRSTYRWKSCRSVIVELVIRRIILHSDDKKTRM